MEPPRTFRELLDCYRIGQRDFSGVELDEDPDCDLRGVCLAGADLSRAFIVADFRDADLRGVRLADANLKTCDFRCTDLRGADFSGAALCSTRFAGALMQGARFAGSHYHSHQLGEEEQPDW